MKKNIMDISLILLGNFLLAVSVAYFILPFDILSGGVAGIAIALEPLFHIPRLVIINVLVIGMFVLGALFLGRNFAIKTVVSALVYPLFINLLAFIPITIEMSSILASFYGGIIAGIGIGLVFRVGASTGGMDIPPLILHKITGIETRHLILITDGLTVLLGLFSYGLEAVLIGLISVATASWMIDKTLTFGGTSAKAIQIISQHWQELNEQILIQLNRGTTLIPAKGGYTFDDRQIILVIIDRRQYPQLVELVNSIDKNAFMITTDTTDVHGEGFKLEFRV